MARSRTASRRAAARRKEWNDSVRRRLPPPEDPAAVKADAEYECNWYDAQPRHIRDAIKEGRDY